MSWLVAASIVNVSSKAESFSHTSLWQLLFCFPPSLTLVIVLGLEQFRIFILFIISLFIYLFRRMRSRERVGERASNRNSVCLAGWAGAATWIRIEGGRKGERQRPPWRDVSLPGGGSFCKCLLEYAELGHAIHSSFIVVSQVGGKVLSKWATLLQIHCASDTLASSRIAKPWTCTPIWDAGAVSDCVMCCTMSLQKCLYFKNSW